MVADKGFVAVDAGNTRLKVTRFSSSGDVEVWNFDASAQDELLGRVAACGAEAGGMASVSRVDARLVESLRSVLGGDFLPVTPDTPLPIAVDYDDPRTLGTDRKATAVAAAVEYPGALCVVIDGGTALTCDVVAEGRFVAGCISPGLSMRFRSLHEHTALLPQLNPTAEALIAMEGGFGCSTPSSIMHGVVRGYMDEVAGAVVAAAESAAAGMPVVALVTGGDAPVIAERLSLMQESGPMAGALKDIGIVYDPHLLAKGVRAIYRHNEDEI